MVPLTICIGQEIIFMARKPCVLQFENHIKFVMRITSIGALMVDILIVFSTNFWIFLGARLVVAALISGCYVATFTYGKLDQGDFRLEVFATI